MKKLLALAALAACFLPTLAFAAFNDLTLTTNAVISVGGYTLNVTGSNAAVQSIVVSASNFSVTLSSGSSIQITSPTYQQLAVDVSTFTASNTCTAQASVLTLSSSGASGTVTVTPQSTVCSTSAAPASTRGGGGGVITGPLSVGYIASNPTATATSTPAATAIMNTAQKINYQFSKNLDLGKTDIGVQKLQQFLNVQGFTVSVAGPGSKGKESTYFGNATRAALIKFQKAQHITPAVGYFGPVTRAAVNSMK